MAATENKTKMPDMMMTAEQRKMANVRQEIAKLFTTYEGFVKEELGKKTREAQEAIKSGDSNAGAIKTKIDDMETIKMNVEACLENLKDKIRPPYDLKSRGEASKGKVKVVFDYELKSKDADMDTKLEHILEDASIKSKMEEFKGLSEQLKMCLLCFSIFPMNAEIVKRVLIYWWIGEGFVTAKGEKTAEEVGEECFQQLVEREFIRPVYNRRRGNILRCRMHPWIRWMIIKLSRNEQFFNLDESGMPSSSPPKSRHACIMTKNEDGQLDEDYWPQSNKPNESKETKQPLKETPKKPCWPVSNKTKQPLKETPKEETPKESKEKEPKGKDSTLLTLFNVNVRYLKFKYGVEFLPKLKTLVVLQLGSWRGSSHDHMDVEDPKKQDDPGHHIEIEEPQMLDGLSALVHLRYLSLRGISRITELPSSIKALQNLEILDLRGCQNLEKLTEEIKWLHRLTHLDVSDCYMLECMPKGLRSLSELQVLKGFVFGGHRSRDPCKLADLQILKKLRKLSISIGKQVNVKLNVDLNALSKIENLRSVAITWSAGPFTQTSFPPSITQTSFPSGITQTSFPSGIVKLDLRCFPESDLSSWFDFKNLEKLEKLYIRGGKLAKLDCRETWKIKMLRLKFLKEMKLENDNIQALFPQLEYLEVYKCDNIKLTDKSYQLDSDGVWVALDGSTTVTPASAAATTTPEASPASTAPTATSEAPPPPAASPITPEAPPASAATTTTIQEAPLASAAPTTEPEAPPASITPATTPEASSASAAPTTTLQAVPATTAPTTTPEAAPASATPTTTSEAAPASAAPTTSPEAPPASAVPTPIPEASPTSAASTTITKEPPASPTPTTTQEASPASTPPTTTAEASSTSTATTATPYAPTASPAPTTTASAAPITTPEVSAASAALATTPEASPASTALATTPEASPASAAPTTTQATPASAAPTTT